MNKEAVECIRETAPRNATLPSGESAE